MTRLTAATNPAAGPGSRHLGSRADTWVAATGSLLEAETMAAIIQRRRLSCGDLRT
jgi:hypothetical protein